LREKRERGERDVVGLQWQKEKYVIDTNLGHQNGRYLRQIVSFDERFILGVFFLPLMFVNKHI
jgi:hypothetical protein